MENVNNEQFVRLLILSLILMFLFTAGIITLYVLLYNAKKTIKDLIPRSQLRVKMAGERNRVVDAVGRQYNMIVDNDFWRIPGLNVFLRFENILQQVKYEELNDVTLDINDIYPLGVNSVGIGYVRSDGIFVLEEVDNTLGTNLIANPKIGDIKVKDLENLCG